MHKDQRKFKLPYRLVAVVLAMTWAHARGADYAVHVVEPAVTNHMILQDEPLPPVCKPGTVMTVWACRGEYEPASFVVTASKPLEQVRIEVGPVTGPSKSWPGDAVDVRVVKEVYRDMPGVSGVMPSLLVHDETFIQANPASTVADPDSLKTNEAGFLVATAPKPGANVLTGQLRDTDELQPVTIAPRKQFWITVRVPVHAHAGKYTTKLRIVPANSDATELTLQISVYPFTLLPPIALVDTIGVVLLPGRSGARGIGGLAQRQALGWRILYHAKSVRGRVQEYDRTRGDQSEHLRWRGHAARWNAGHRPYRRNPGGARRSRNGPGPAAVHDERRRRTRVAPAY